MAAPHGILNKKMVVPPAMVSGMGVCIQQGGREVRGKVGELQSYLSVSAGMSCRILSHTCGHWYLPRFLFREGSLALM